MRGPRRLTATGRRSGAGSTFLLGCGAHLAGTTALHRWLSASPQHAAGAWREYHVLDSAGLPSAQSKREALLDEAQTSLDRVRREGEADGDALMRAAMIADPRVYVDHVAGLLAPPAVRVTSDLTPDHAMLSAEQLAAVRDAFAERGIRVAAAFAMRDPLARVVTHVRLLQRHQPEDHPGPLEDWVAKLHTEPAFEVRTRYDRTIAALDAALEPDDVWFGFHERLLAPDSLRTLARVCRTDVHDVADLPALRQPTATEGLPEDLAREVVVHHAAVYEQVADRFGIDDLVTLWPSARWL